MREDVKAVALDDDETKDDADTKATTPASESAFKRSKLRVFNC